MVGTSDSLDLTVYCVYWGDKYHKGYVYALKEMVEKNLAVPHTFKCITTDSFPGINTVKPWVSYSGWWQKIGLFCPHITNGPSLYFDLDVIITGSIDYLVPYTTNHLSAPANWAQSGHGGIQSSVMAWNGQFHRPYDEFNYPVDSKRLWGDQEYLWELLADDWVRVPHVGSYKYHCRSHLPDDLRVVVFHGRPDPHEVTDPWILSYTSTLRSHINGNMVNGYPKDLSDTG